MESGSWLVDRTAEVVSGKTGQESSRLVASCQLQLQQDTVGKQPVAASTGHLLKMRATAILLLICSAIAQVMIDPRLQILSLFKFDIFIIFNSLKLSDQKRSFRMEATLVVVAVAR